MVASPHDYAEIIMGDRLPIIRGTTANLAVVNNPFLLETCLINPKTGRKVPGIPKGFGGLDRSGGIFYWDAVQVFQAELATNTNVTYLGKIGKRKSTDIHGEVVVGAEMGYNHLITDPKGEYEELVNLVPGAKLLRFGAGSDLFLNALDPMIAEGPDSNDRPQLTLIASMAVTGLEGTNRPSLTGSETSYLWKAIEDIRTAHDVPVLPQLIDRLRNPTKEMLASVEYGPNDRDKATSDMKELIISLNRFSEGGDLGGFFHRPTTPGLFDVVPLLVLSTKGIKGVRAGVAVNLLNFLTQSVWATSSPVERRFHKAIYDEAWDLAPIPGFLESLQRGQKLGSKQGVSVIIVAHHIASLFRSGAGSKVVEDLAADTGTFVLYAQEEAELTPYMELLRLNEVEVKHVIGQDPGHALYKVETLPGIPVENMISTYVPEVRRVPQSRPLLQPMQ